MFLYRLPMLALCVAATAVPAGARAQSNSILTLLPTDDRRLEVGGEFSGALSTADFVSVDSYLLEAWEIQGRAGQTVTVDMISDAFDSRLYATGPGFARVLSDDDSGAGCNARLTITFLESGTFRVVASSYDETGTYRIVVSEQPDPTPAYGCGEVNPEALTTLPVTGTLEMGSVEAGVLRSGSRTVQDGRPGEAWSLVGRAGERVSITLESEDFDSYLYLTGPGLGEILTDDDSAGDLDSRIEVTLPVDGTYTVVAAALSSGNFGAYVLRVDEPLDPTDLAIVRTTSLGESQTGQLSNFDDEIFDGRRGQVWGFEASAGQRVVIDLESEDFDTYLYVTGPGFAEPLSNDDGGDNTNSMLSVTFPATGTYRIVPSAYGGGTGAFTLSVR